MVLTGAGLGFSVHVNVGKWDGLVDPDLGFQAGGLEPQ